MPEGFYKISVGIPPEFSERLKDAVTAAIEPVYPGYDRAFTEYRTAGTWRPLPGSHPYDGKIMEITTADEMRIEFAVKEKDLAHALEAIVSVHPYEEPAIDVLPMIGWKDIIRP